MKKATARASDVVRVQQIDHFVDASLLLDDWLDWMSCLSGQSAGTEELYFLRSRDPRLTIIPRLDPPAEEENRDAVIAYGLSVFWERNDFVRDAIHTWLHLLVAPSPLRVDSTSESTGAVCSSLFHMSEPTTGLRSLWMGFPESIVDPSAHEAVLEWYATFLSFVRNVVAPACSRSPVDLFRESDSWTEVPSFAPCFENFVWNRNQAARLAAVMERERRILYQGWQHDPAIPAQILLEYRQLWRRDRRLRLEVTESLAKLSLVDRLILKKLRSGPLKKAILCNELCGPKENVPGNFNTSVERLKQMRLISGGTGRGSTGYQLTDIGNEVAEAIDCATRPPERPFKA